MPEEVESCVESVLSDNPDYDESTAYAICYSQQKDVDDSEALAAVAAKMQSGEWHGIHPAEKSASGREHLLETYSSLAKEFLPITVSTERRTFKAQTRGSMGIIYKEDDGSMWIWGPASVEVVDKENDIIRSEALENALPQLLRRERISVDHSDQLVGKIKQSIEVDEPVELEINGETVKRDSFPTAVLDPEKDDVPEKGLYVAAEIWDDTRQAREAQKAIERGEYDSYSISGETLDSKTQVKGQDIIEDISEVDLSAVTLCESGMNQRAKFGVVSKSHPAFAKDAENLMSDTESNSDDSVSKDTLEAFKEAAREVLPEGKIATKDDFDEFEASMAEKYGLETEEKGKDLASDEAKDALMQLADATGYDPDEIANAVREGVGADDPGEIEAEDEEDDMPPEDDMMDEVDEEVIEDPDDDDEAEVEVVDDDEEEKSVIDQLEEKGVPDDLVETVKEYFPEQTAKGDDMDDDDDDDSDEGSVSKSDDPAEAAIEEAFYTVEGAGPIMGDESIAKEYDVESEGGDTVAYEQFKDSQGLE